MKKVILSLSIDEAKLLHNGASQERKLELEEIFPKLKPISIIDRVKTYEDALKVLGRNHFNETNLYPREIARRKLEIIIEALNEGLTINRNTISERKWYPYFQISTAGLGCSSASYSPSAAAASIGVLLCLKTKELAVYAGTQFTKLYETMLLE